MTCTLLVMTAALSTRAQPFDDDALGVVADNHRVKVLILFDNLNRDRDLSAAVRRSIEASGGRVQARIGLAGMVADIELGSAPAIAGMPGVAGIYDNILDAAPFNDPDTVGAVTAWNHFLDPPLAEDWQGDDPPPDVRVAPDLPANDADRQRVQETYESYKSATLRSGCGSNGAGFYDTSLYLAGDIAVGVFHTTTGWTPADVNTSFGAIVGALLTYFDQAEPDGRIVFTFINEIDGGGNPLAKPSNERLYDNDLRNAWCTDWAYMIEVRRDGTWPNAFLHGPSLRLDWSWYPYDQVVLHETGHVFGAMDQYCPVGPNSRYGYVMATHGNACGSDGTGYFSGAGDDMPDLMSGWTQCHGYSKMIGPFTAGQFGWYDHDGDGVLDVLTTQPVIDKTSVVHTAGSAPTYTGIAVEKPLLKELGSPYTSVSINRITGVQYRINKTAWQNATAADGVFDSASEAFLFQPPPLKNGTYTVDIRATNTVGRSTVIPYTEQLVISGSSTTNTRPFGVLSLSSSQGHVIKPVTAQGGASRDIETPTASLQYSWNWGDGSGWTAFSAASSASHLYSTPGIYAVEMRVRDAQGVFHVVSQPFEATSYDTHPKITFRVRRENTHGFGPNYPLNGTAVKVSDAEGDESTLSIRWDLEDDGIFTPWMAIPAGRSHTSWAPSKSIALPPLCTPTLIYPKSERRKVVVEVRDSAFNVTRAERYIWMVPYNNNPTAPFFGGVTFVASAGGYNATAHASDQDKPLAWDGLLEYRWDFESDGIWDTPFEPAATRWVPSRGTLSVEAQDRFQARVLISPLLFSSSPALAPTDVLRP